MSSLCFFIYCLSTTTLEGVGIGGRWILMENIK